MEEYEVEDQTDFVVYSYLLFVDEQGTHRHSSIASILWYDDEDDEPLMTRCIISTHHTPLHDHDPRSEEEGLGDESMLLATATFFSRRRRRLESGN